MASARCAAVFVLMSLAGAMGVVAVLAASVTLENEPHQQRPFVSIPNDKPSSVAAAAMSEPFSNERITSICDRIKLDTVAANHGKYIADTLRKVCEDSREAVQDADNAVCVTGCTTADLCGMPATASCAPYTDVWKCDVVNEVIYGAGPDKGRLHDQQPSIFRVRRGTCLTISPSDERWPLCSPTPSFLHGLARFPTEVRAVFSEGLGTGQFPTDWNVLVVPGKPAVLPVGGALDRPPSMASETPAPAVRVPCFLTGTTSYYPGGDGPDGRRAWKDHARQTTRNELLEAARSGNRPPRLAVTLVGNDKLRPGIDASPFPNYNGVSSPVTGVALSGGNIPERGVYLAMLLELLGEPEDAREGPAKALILEAREVVSYDDGSTSVAHRRTPGTEIHLDLIVAEIAWRGFKDRDRADEPCEVAFI